MKPIEKELLTGVIVSDHLVKIGDIARATLNKELLKQIESKATPVYVDQTNLAEHLYEVGDLVDLQSLVHGQPLVQLNEIFGFIKSRQLSYVRFV